MKRLVIALFALLLMPLMVHAATFAQLALGGGWEATLIVTNKTNSLWSGKIHARQGNDQRWNGAWSINSQDFTGADYMAFDLYARQTRKFILRGDSIMRNGYLKVEGNAGFPTSNIAMSYVCQLFEGGRVVNTTGVGESKTGDRFVFPVEIGPAVQTGYAISPHVVSSPFPIRLTLYDNSGYIYGSALMTFYGQFAEFIYQRFPGVGNNFVGYALVEAQGIIGLEVSRMEYGVGWALFTATPPDNDVP